MLVIYLKLVIVVTMSTALLLFSSSFSSSLFYLAEPRGMRDLSSSTGD